MPADRARSITVGAGVLVATVVVVGLLTPGYRPWADAISRLGACDEPYRWPWRLGFAGFGLLVARGAPAIAAHARHSSALVHGLVVAFGICCAIVGLAPKDPPGAPHTFVSRLHVDVAIVGGALVLFAMALVARDAPVRRDRILSGVVAGAALVGVAVFPFTWGTTVYGVIELFLVAAAATWLVIVSRATSVSSCAVGPKTNASRSRSRSRYRCGRGATA